MLDMGNKNIANDKKIQNIDRRNKQSELDHKNEQSRSKIKYSINVHNRPTLKKNQLHVVLKPTHNYPKC